MVNENEAATLPTATDSLPEVSKASHKLERFQKRQRAENIFEKTLAQSFIWIVLIMRGLYDDGKEKGHWVFSFISLEP